MYEKKCIRKESVRISSLFLYMSKTKSYRKLWLSIILIKMNML